MRDVAIIGCGMTKFGRHEDRSLLDLAVESSLIAVQDAGCSDDIDAVEVGSMLPGELNNQTALATALIDQLGLMPLAADRVENGPASGASAVKHAFSAIACGLYDVVLVTGCEKMRHVSAERVTDIISTMTHPTAEYVHGVTLPSLAGMLARIYMHRYGLTLEHLALVAIKNQLNGSKNPYAHIQQPITLAGIYSSKEAEVNNPVVSDPIRLYDCCPITDGAASLVLCSRDKAKEYTDNLVKIAGVGHATDTLALQDRRDPAVLEAVKLACQQAFKMAKLSPKDMDLAELHDAFTILEIVESEDVGFFEKGAGKSALKEGLTSIDGEIPINPSGGLKARGHPVGATGVAQLVELTWQLQGEAAGRQVKQAERGFSCNLGGFANNVVAYVLARGK